MRWVRWAFLGGRWRRIAEGDSLDECARRMSEFRQQNSPLPNLAECMTGGGAPSFEPRWRGEGVPTGTSDCRGGKIQLQADMKGG
jgi:hypothetical protein